MNQDKCDAIEAYLKQEFPASNVEQANISDNQNYRIPTESGLLMLRVGREFIDDNSIEEIINKLSSWKVPELLAQHSEMGILVTDSGPSTYQRS